MRLNALSPKKGAKKDRKRLGRGIGSGLGKTSGRGHKGQKSRSGKRIPRAFEGGQMPLHRRLPKFGFTSRKATSSVEVRLSDLEKIKGSIVSLSSLRSAGIINAKIKIAKIIASGEISIPVVIRGISVTKGARAAIKAFGGKIEG